MKRIAILGDFNRASARHLDTTASIQHARIESSPVEGEWIATDDIDSSLFTHYQGIWVAPGSPYRNMKRVLWAIQHARERGVAC